MSNGNYGMQTAAENYYGKDLKDLSIPQLALLAGMPQAPNNTILILILSCLEDETLFVRNAKARIPYSRTI